jgi:hypothetical protein
MQVSGVEQELAAKALEKSKMMVSFAITLTAQKPKLPNVVARVLNSKSASNLETRFNEECDATDKVDLSFEDLEAPVSDDWVEKEPDSTSVSPSVAQCNSLIHQVKNLSTGFATTREVLAAVAEVLESQFNVMGSQVISLHGSIGDHPFELSHNLNELDLWGDAVKFDEEVADAREICNHPKLLYYDTMTRSLVDLPQVVLKKQGYAILTLLNTGKAEYVCQVKPLETVLDNTSSDLYSPRGAYNKVLMVGTVPRSEESSHLHSQVELLANQIKQLTGN